MPSQAIKPFLQIASYVISTIHLDMDSMQESRAAAEKHVAAHDEVVKEAAGSSHTPNARAQDIASTYMLNQTLGLRLELLKRHVWCGSVVGTFPPTIKREAGGTIMSRGKPPGDPAGSKVAVVYAGSNVLDGPNNCAWLLAWHVPADGTTSSKVYVEAGDIRKYSGEIQWEDVEAKLDGSSNQTYYMDDDTGSIASANIEKPYITKINAVFDVAKI